MPTVRKMRPRFRHDCDVAGRERDGDWRGSPGVYSCSRAGGLDNKSCLVLQPRWVAFRSSLSREAIHSNGCGKAKHLAVSLHLYDAEQMHRFLSLRGQSLDLFFLPLAAWDFRVRPLASGFPAFRACARGASAGLSRIRHGQLLGIVGGEIAAFPSLQMGPDRGLCVPAIQRCKQLSPWSSWVLFWRSEETYLYQAFSAAIVLCRLCGARRRDRGGTVLLRQLST